MPKTDTWGQSIQYPVLSDAADIEIALSTMVNGFTPKLVMRFANANARAAALTGATKPVPGMITYLIAEDRWEGRQADGTWLLMSDGPWQPLSLISTYAANSGSPGWRKKAGGGIELRGTVKPKNGKLNDGPDALKFGSVPSSIAPAGSRFFTVPTTRVVISGVTHDTARLQVATNGDLLYMCDAGAGQGTTTSPHWFSLDGVMFSPDGD
ncbi:hypothetical protein J3S85_37855 [Streptomyces lavenduligriseus]|nr:hypothetical protein J3S85_37855 [Streptomyces lavenduligriseus]